jgi:hypothetical protein
LNQNALKRNPEDELKEMERILEGKNTEASRQLLELFHTIYDKITFLQQRSDSRILSEKPGSD